MGSQLGEIFQRNQLPSEQVIGLLKKLLSDPQQATSCAASPQAVWHLVVGLDQQGYPIQGLQATTPLTQLIEDYSGRRTGILADGTMAEEIPGSALVVAGRSKYTLLPAGAAAKISLRGNDTGSLDLKVIDFLDQNVWLATYQTAGDQRKDPRRAGAIRRGAHLEAGYDRHRDLRPVRGTFSRSIPHHPRLAADAHPGSAAGDLHPGAAAQRHGSSRRTGDRGYPQQPHTAYPGPIGHPRLAERPDARPGFGLRCALQLPIGNWAAGAGRLAVEKKTISQPAFPADLPASPAQSS